MILFVASVLAFWLLVACLLCLPFARFLAEASGTYELADRVLSEDEPADCVAEWLEDRRIDQ